ncbi:uncharacterized protein CEXT_776161 [Caerostris extrusa]|uniref:Uncharacterized protein n=1 Tax=Caerostris extrusa TaxID=172846 RepID=A0AAV4NCJ2_CAEEX|nr:uncharacterized protein CEXT_776161 [Caerostris extrusa]
MLLVGVGVGVLILVMEHVMFRYALPYLRKRPKDCIWRSPNLMFFSQKLYRFINTVELVSPHHSVKEIISNLREGQIASLFQKSVKRVRQQNDPKTSMTWEDSRTQLTSPQNGILQFDEHCHFFFNRIRTRLSASASDLTSMQVKEDPWMKLGVLTSPRVRSLDDIQTYAGTP